MDTDRTPYAIDSPPEQDAKIIDLLKHIKGPDNTGEPPEGDDMEKRVARLETAFETVQGSLSRMDDHFDKMDARFDKVDARHESMMNSMASLQASQATLLERMDRVMDKTRDMPTEGKVNSLLNAKVTSATAILALIIAAITYLKP